MDSYTILTSSATICESVYIDANLNTVVTALVDNKCGFVIITSLSFSLLFAENSCRVIINLHEV